MLTFIISLAHESLTRQLKSFCGDDVLLCTGQPVYRFIICSLILEGPKEDWICQLGHPLLTNLIISLSFVPTETEHK